VLPQIVAGQEEDAGALLFAILDVEITDPR
jgi:hypothetical protein